MSENPPDDMESLLDELTQDESESKASFAADEDAPGSLSEALADERPEDSSKGESIQVLEQSHSQKSVSTGVLSPRDTTDTLIEELIADSSDEIEIRWGLTPVKKAKDSDLITHLQRTCSDLNELMAWKEQLRLLTVSYVVPAPYYEGWTKEANLFFRRLVIIKKRMELLKKQKRA